MSIKTIVVTGMLLLAGTEEYGKVRISERMG